MKLSFSTPNPLKRKCIKIVQILLANFLPEKIISGEFQGLTISKNIFGSAYTPKILGTYEEEISGLIKNRLLDKKFLRFVDVGCAGGYYCEIARQLRPDIQIEGYDLNADAIEHCKKILNDGIFKIEEFRYNDYYDVNYPILFLFDIEGGEFEIFTEINELNPMHEFIIEIHSFGKNVDKSIDILNSENFDIIEIPFRELKVAQSHRSYMVFLEYFLRHELRDARTRFIHIRPKTGNKAM